MWNGDLYEVSEDPCRIGLFDREAVSCCVLADYRDLMFSDGGFSDNMEKRKCGDPLRYFI